MTDLFLTKMIEAYLSLSMYLVRNIQHYSHIADRKKKRKIIVKFVWPCRILIPGAFGNLFWISSKSTPDWLKDGRYSNFADIFFHKNAEWFPFMTFVYDWALYIHGHKILWKVCSSCMPSILLKTIYNLIWLIRDFLAAHCNINGHKRKVSIVLIFNYFR